MTGIEHLREIADKYAEASKDHATIDVIPGGVAWLLSDIADQIECERACDGDTTENVRLIVGGVVDEMERHVLGVEGMEDSPVARWARELREALGGHVEEVTDVATIRKDAYDAYEWVEAHGGLDVVSRALTPSAKSSNRKNFYDRLALGWIEDNGGLDHVRSQWGYLKGRANHADHVDRQLEKRQRQIDECHAALRRRNEEREQYVKANKRLLERGAELHRQLLKAQGDALEKDCNLAEIKNDIRELCLAHGIDVPGGGDALDAIDMRLHDMQKALNKRLMPEGMEWPMWDDGKPVTYDDAPDDVIGMYLALDGSGYALMTDLPDQLMSESGERVKRPAPKVLGADGEEIREGETPYRVDNGKQVEIRRIDTSYGESCVFVGVDGMSYGYWLRPDQLTHERPDSWERLEEDAKKLTCDYFGHDGGETCETCPGYMDSTPQGGRGCRYAQMADLVRRAKKLAERDA